MSYLIVGGSVAGISAAKAIRRKDPSAEIKIISEENKPYCRPMIPLLLSGERDGSEILWPEDIEKTAWVQVIHDRATLIDHESKSLKLAGGGALGYRKILIATGAKPRKLDVKGSDTKGVFTFRTIEDVIKIREMAANAKKAVVIGGGFTGIKAAEALTKKGIKTTVIEIMPHILHPRLDSVGAGIVASALAAEGIELVLNETVHEIASVNGHAAGVITTSSKAFRADFVVVAVGTSPNMELAEKSGISMGKGIIVNDNLATNLPDVYSAGDAVQFRDIVTGQDSVSALWSNAAEMGRIAGSNMAGENLKYGGLLSVKNATEIAGISMISAGEASGTGHEVYSHTGPGYYRKLVFDRDVLIGAIFMGDLSGAGIYVNLINNHAPLEGLKSLAIENKIDYAALLSSHVAEAIK